MNNQGQAVVIGFALLVVFFLFMLALLATIVPFKEVFDEARGNSALNCPGTPNFNQSDFDDDDAEVENVVPWNVAITTTQQVAVIGDYAYLFGGYDGVSSTDTIYRATTTNPTSWIDTGSTLPACLPLLRSTTWITAGQRFAMQADQPSA